MESHEPGQSGADRGRSELPRRGALPGSAGASSRRAYRVPHRPPSSTRAEGGSRTAVDLERFVEDCVSASQESDAQAAVKEVLVRGVHDPRALMAAVGEPRQAGLGVLHRSSTLTILSAVWTPLMNLVPHDHRMWALIGIYTGREDNIFWRRSEEGVTAEHAACLFEGDVGVLPEDAIHSVTNPLERFTGGIHVYGGDFFATTRSQWDPESRAEQPSDGDVIQEFFRRANERMRRTR